MKESNLSQIIRLAISKYTKATVFRNNTGTGWVGKTKNVKNGKGIFIDSPRPLNAGLCKGSSDLIGWTEVEITPDMLGKKIAVFTAIEVKNGGKYHVSNEQLTFIDNVRKAGGISGIVTSPNDAIYLINKSKLL